jgi:hypothetical protein
MSSDYGYEKLYQAMLCLIGTNTIQIRLNCAYQYLIRLEDDTDFKEEHRQEFLEIMNALPQTEDESLEYRTGLLEDLEATRLAEKIFAFFCKIAEVQGEIDRLRDFNSAT